MSRCLCWSLAYAGGWALQGSGGWPVPSRSRGASGSGGAETNPCDPQPVGTDRVGAGGWPGPGLGSSVSSAPRSLCALGPQGCLWHQGREDWASWTGQRGYDPASKSRLHYGHPRHLSVHTEVEAHVRVRACTCRRVHACSLGGACGFCQHLTHVQLVDGSL